MQNITPGYITKKIAEYITNKSGFETRRDYISISHLADCPRRVVREYHAGFDVSATTHHMAYAGYHQERDILEMLTNMGMLEQVNVEVVAPFDGRLRGHMDGVLENCVLECKSVSGRRWDGILKKADRLPWKHYVQVQMYMRYSGMRNAVVIYRNRETYEHMVIMVPYNQTQADKFEMKAKEILLALDDEVMPECECGKCRE